MRKDLRSLKPTSHNRIAALMAHTSRYSFRGTARLAKDSRVSKSTICHLVHGRTSPLYRTLAKVIRNLEFQLARKLNVREVISDDGTYPTKHICKLVGCRGCLPDSIHNDDGSVKEQWAGIRPGRWTGDVAEFIDEEVGAKC